MFDSVIFENGNRKVVGEARTIKNDMHNVLTFYEDGKEVMFAILYGKKFLEFKSPQFRKLSGYSFIEVFLSEGIKEMKIEDIVNYFGASRRDYWEMVIFLENGMEFEYLDELFYSSNLLFKFKEKVHRAKLKRNDLTYSELSRLTVKTIFDHICCISIQGMESYKACLKDYNMEFCTYPEMIDRLIEVEYLKEIEYYSTGHFFKISDETKKELVKRKLLFGELPMLLAVDSNGYAIFDGVPYMCNK